MKQRRYLFTVPPFLHTVLDSFLPCLDHFWNGLDRLYGILGPSFIFGLKFWFNVDKSSIQLGNSTQSGNVQFNSLKSNRDQWEFFSPFVVFLAAGPSVLFGMSRRVSRPLNNLVPAFFCPFFITVFLFSLFCYFFPYVIFTYAPRSRSQIIIVVGLSEFKIPLERLIVHVNRRLRWTFSSLAHSFELSACIATVYEIWKTIYPP